ncbi:MAG: class I SAM-dependent methyltransferase, partial [Microcoleus sp.]
MISTVRKTKLEYGDFQTPPELAEMVCRKLIELDINPKIIIEPTCGIGNFIQAAANYFPSANKIIGVEINQSYLIELRAKHELLQDDRCEVKQGDFFEFDWTSLIKQFNHQVLVLGNFPWVT